MVLNVINRRDDRSISLIIVIFLYRYDYYDCYGKILHNLMYPVYRSRERDAKSYQREMVGDTLSLISEKVIYVNGFTVCHRRRKKKRHRGERNRIRNG